MICNHSTMYVAVIVGKYSLIVYMAQVNVKGLLVGNSFILRRSFSVVMCMAARSSSISIGLKKNDAHLRFINSILLLWSSLLQILTPILILKIRRNGGIPLIQGGISLLLGKIGVGWLVGTRDATIPGTRSFFLEPVESVWKFSLWAYRMLGGGVCHIVKKRW